MPFLIPPMTHMGLKGEQNPALLDASPSPKCQCHCRRDSNVLNSK